MTDDREAIFSRVRGALAPLRDRAPLPVRAVDSVQAKRRVTMMVRPLPSAVALAAALVLVACGKKEEAPPAAAPAAAP